MSVGTYTIAAYDPVWPLRFEAERAAIASRLRLAPDRVEHIGSTSVPGLGAKPVIDLMVGVGCAPPCPEVSSLLVELGRLGYAHSGQETVPGTLYCKKAEPYRCNLHLTEYSGDFWKTHLAFRNYLRAHPDTRSEYEALKRRNVADMGGDLRAQIGAQAYAQRYNDLKAAFIVEVTTRALSLAHRRSRRP